MEDNNSQKTAAENNQETIFTEEDFLLGGYDKHIRQARNAIYVAAIVLAISLIIFSFTVPDGYEYFWIDLILWGAFIVGFVLLALWTKKKPYTAIIAALILYFLFIILNAVLDVSTIYKGLLIKIGIIVYLIKGTKDAKEAQLMRQQING